MMSTVTTFSFAEPGLVNQLSDFQTGFTPWDFDCSDLFSAIQNEPGIPSPCSGESETDSIRIKTGSGSDESCIDSIKTNSGSDDSDGFLAVPSPQSDEMDSENTRIWSNVTNSCDFTRKKLNRPVSRVIDDRKRKRMESNRESAKRSRMRKQRHIEDLRDEVNRLGLENRELGNRLRIVLYHFEQINADNNQLLSEHEILRQRFLHMRQILILKELHNQQQWGRGNGRMIIDHQTV